MILVGFENEKKAVSKLVFGDYFHGELWYRCPHCGKAIEGHSISETEDGIHKCFKCGGEYYYKRFER